MRNRTWARALAFVLPVLAAGAVFAQGGGLVSDGVSPDLALVFTGDTIGYIEPCG